MFHKGINLMPCNCVNWSVGIGQIWKLFSERKYCEILWGKVGGNIYFRGNAFCIRFCELQSLISFLSSSQTCLWQTWYCYTWLLGYHSWVTVHNMIWFTVLQWPSYHLFQTVQKAPHISPLQASYRVFAVRILEGLHCGRLGILLSTCGPYQKYCFIMRW